MIPLFSADSEESVDAEAVLFEPEDDSVLHDGAVDLNDGDEVPGTNGSVLMEVDNEEPEELPPSKKSKPNVQKSSSRDQNTKDRKVVHLPEALLTLGAQQEAV